jgi:hypothetical protein
MCWSLYILVRIVFLLWSTIDSSSLPRPYVKSLVEGLGRAASYKGYRTFNDAALDYNKSKSLGLVRIRRLPGDDLFYGPESEAMQGEIRF